MKISKILALTVWIASGLSFNLFAQAQVADPSRDLLLVVEGQSSDVAEMAGLPIITGIVQNPVPARGFFRMYFILNRDSSGNVISASSTVELERRAASMSEEVPEIHEIGSLDSTGVFVESRNGSGVWLNIPFADEEGGNLRIWIPKKGGPDVLADGSRRGYRVYSRASLSWGGEVLLRSGDWVRLSSDTDSPEQIPVHVLCTRSLKGLSAKAK